MEQYRSFLIYGFTMFFNAAISFVTFSLLTHYLNEVDYGIINLYNSFVIFLTPFVSIGVQFAVGIDYFTMNESTYRKHFTNAMVIPAVACVFCTILFVCFSSFIQSFSNTTLFYTLTIPFACLLTILIDIFFSLFRNKEKHFLFAGFSILKNLTEIGFTILLVVYLGYNWEGRLESFLLTLVIILLLILYVIRKWGLFTGRVDKQDIGNILKNGLPFVPERLAIFVRVYSDRFFINYFEGTADVGFYSAAAQIAVIVYMTTLTLNTAFYPQIFKALSEKEPDYKKLKKVTLIFIGISLLVTIVVVFSIPIFFKFFIGPAFQEGQHYAVFLTLGSFFWSLYNVFLPYLLSLKKNKLIMNISIAGMMISLISNYFNIKYLGALGATYTSIAVYFFMAAVTIFFINKNYGLRKIFNA